MTPGNPQILTCPFCGTEKQIMSLVSGNTFGAEYWSDNKQIARMLPEISYIQKCPHCGKYYIKSRQDVKYAKEGWSFDQGLLTFAEIKEAYNQIAGEGFVNRQEESNVRMMLFHAYNDFYYRKEQSHDVDPSDHKMFVEHGLWLINNLITDDVLKAEFYREIGLMEKAKQCLSNVKSDDDFINEIVQSVRERIDSNDSKVFRIR